MGILATAARVRRGRSFVPGNGLQGNALRANLLMLVLGAGWLMPEPDLILNVTESAPYGLYRVQPVERLAYGDRVVFPVPPAVRALVFGRHWLPLGGALVKPVAGLSGDRVCITNDTVFVSGRPRGPVWIVDRQGLPLPRVRGCFTLRPGEVFTLSTQSRTSFDGRYYGAIDRADIRGIATPLWTFSR